MSHKQSEELKQKIQSEKQRMEREQEIRVPYHKPKQHTLKEFMARRTLKKPQIDKSDGQKPMSSILQLKLVGQNIESFAQKMKEREEEAIEFFKSESESDDEELELTEDKENISANQDVSMTEALVKKEEQQDEIMREELKANPVELGIVNEESSVVEPQPSPLDEENQIALDVPDASKAIELEQPEELVNAEAPTEKVPEDSNLNQLREKYNNMNTDDVMPKLSFPTLKTLEEMGSNNFVIDLESGAIEPRKLSGAEKLFQRYLKTVQKPKHKDSVCMNIISIENGKLENQKIEVKLDKEVELDHNRPGLSREKLRESIRQKIDEQRIVKIKEKIVKQEPGELEPEDKDDCANAEKESLLSDDEECSEDEDVEEDDIEDEEEADNERPRKSKPKCSFADDEVESF